VRSRQAGNVFGQLFVEVVEGRGGIVLEQHPGLQHRGPGTPGGIRFAGFLLQFLHLGSLGSPSPYISSSSFSTFIARSASGDIPVAASSATGAAPPPPVS